MEPIEVGFHVSMWSFLVAFLGFAYWLCGTAFGFRVATAIAALIGILTAMSLNARADCRAFFRHKQAVVVQQVAVAVPVAVYPPVYYAAGQDIQIEAAVERVLRLREQGLTKGYTAPIQAPVQAPVQAPIQAPAKEALTPLQQVAPIAFTKCTRCHTGPEAAGGLVLDGTPLSDHVYKRWGEIAGINKNVPVKMQGLVAALTAEEKGAINEAILLLSADEPRVVQPAPPPAPDGGLQ